MHHRLAAFVIDWHIRTIPLGAWGLYLFTKWYPPFFAAALRNQDNLLALALNLLLPPLNDTFIAWSGIAALVFYLLYHPLIELLMHGDSPGKRMSGISVRTLEDKAPGPRAILWRNLWRAIEFLPVAYLLGFLVMLRSPEHARLGDRAARTRVVMRAPRNTA